MPAIAIAQMSRLQVEHTDEDRHEHVGGVLVAGRLVDGLHDACGIVVVGRVRSEQRTGARHQHGRGRTLAADIANAEEQLPVADKVVEQVASHLSGRRQRTEDIHLVVVQMLFG